MTMNTDQIQALQALAERATPGWTEDDDFLRINDADGRQVADFDDHWIEGEDEDGCWGRIGGDNRRFVLAAREAVPALCADLLAARDEVARLNSIIATAAPADFLPINTPAEFVAAVEIQRLRAEVERLREALGPFAEAARGYENRILPLHVPVYLGDLRRARIALGDAQ